MPRSLYVPLLRLLVATLRGIPEVIALATGAHKAEAVYACVRGGFANSLVADAALGRALIALSPGRRRLRPTGMG